MKMDFMSGVRYIESDGLDSHLHHSTISGKAEEVLTADLNLR